MKNTPLPQTSADPADPVRKLVVDVPTMCTMLHVGLSTGWNLVTKPAPDTGKPPIESIVVGRRHLPLVESINEFVESRRTQRFRKIANPPPGEGRKRHRVNREISPEA